MVFQAHPGDILAGKYRVDRVLGIGGMGMVVAATHLELDQAVALKFMLGELANSPNLLDRFLREARAVAKLRGEHVCRIFDVGRLENGSPYIVMELLKGEDFAAVLSREGVLQPHVAVTYMLQAIEGVAEAHAEGIVHRDLKPGNLFITTDRDGTPLVKVLDFGISKSSTAPATRTGDIMGSPGYMAPEQMSNAKATDARTDVWALGVILYQALSARMPWTGDSLPALCMSVITDAAPPLPDAIPEGLRTAVMRCLAKERDGRFGNVGELAAALAPYGDADASATAIRISKIITSTSAQLPAVITSSSGVPATVASGGTALAAGAPIGGVSAPSSTDPHTPNHPIEAATALARPAKAEAPTPTPVRPVSTISSSAAEIKVPPIEQPAKSSKKVVMVAGAGILAAGSLALAIGLGGGGKKSEQVAASPPTQPSTPAVTPPAPKPEPKPEPKPAAPVKLDCTLPGTLDTSGKQATEYKCGKIDFKAKACQCEIGAFAMRTADNVAVCHQVPSGCSPPVSEPVATKPTTTTRPTTTARPTTTPPKPGEPKPGEPKPSEKKPDELWMQMTHDKDKK